MRYRLNLSSCKVLCIISYTKSSHSSLYCFFEEIGNVQGCLLSFEGFLSHRPTLHKCVNESKLFEEQSRIYQGCVWISVECMYVCECGFVFVHKCMCVWERKRERRGHHASENISSAGKTFAFEEKLTKLRFAAANRDSVLTKTCSIHKIYVCLCLAKACLEHSWDCCRHMTEEEFLLQLLRGSQINTDVLTDLPPSITVTF